MTQGQSLENRAVALAFLTAFVTLFAQILAHRVISVKLLNNYAFLVISLTMLGFAFSGVVLSIWRDRLMARRDDAIAASAAFFALSLLGVCTFFYRAETDWGLPLHKIDFLETLALALPLALPFAIPFAFCGLILGILLASADFNSRRVYSFDLAGSGLGAFAVIPAISAWGAEANLLACCLLLTGGVWAFTRAGRAAQSLLAVAIFAVVLAGVYREPLFEMRYPNGSVLAGTQTANSQVKIEQILWDPVARVELTRIPPIDHEKNTYPSLFGSNPDFHARFTKMFTQNNYAFTIAPDYDGTQVSLKGIEETIYAGAYQARAVDRPKVLAIGVGGGFDILTGLAFDAREIKGVEVNAATLRILKDLDRDYFRHWVSDPRVQLVLAEGRHFLATTEERYDVLQLSGVDSYAGTPGAAHVFSESYLYTEEAMDIYLSRLTEHGILNLMRLEYRPPREMLRAQITAVAALRRAGIARPAEHVVMIAARNGGFTSMLVKRSPFLAEEIARLAVWTSQSPFFEMAAAPGYRPERPSMYQAFLDLADPARERAFAAAYPFDVRPATDDRPFFFKFSYWEHLFSADPPFQAAAPVMEMTVLVLLVLIGGAAIVCIYLPLRLLAGTGKTRRGTWREGVYFGATGIGFLAIEVALLQKFGLFLGHPNYALSVVLAALLVSSGIGSLVSGALIRAVGGIRFVSYGLAAIVLLGHLLVLPHLADGLSLPFAARVAIVFILILPLGLGLGAYVPSGIERLKQQAPEFIPWAWGINGIFSVLAPVLAIALSMTWGIDALLLSAIPVYLIAGWVVTPISNPLPQPSPSLSAD